MAPETEMRVQGHQYLCFHLPGHMATLQVLGKAKQWCSGQSNEKLSNMCCPGNGPKKLPWVTVSFSAFLISWLERGDFKGQ